MNPGIEQLYQDIGQEMIDSAPFHAGKLLLYTEIADDMLSVSFFYEKANGQIQYMPSWKEIEDLVISFWKEWRMRPGNQPWREMAYGVTDGKFKLELFYEDKINEFEDFLQRRTNYAEHFFGDININYEL